MQQPSIGTLEDDLSHILLHTKALWENLRGKAVFLTGGTGFFGIWFLESFAKANAELALNANVLVLTRNAEAFKAKAPHLAADPAIAFHTGDIRSFVFPKGQFSHVIHAAATNADATFNNTETPLDKYTNVVDGTRRTLEFAAQCHADKFLLLSSGSVYGHQPADMTHVSEDYCGAPSTIDQNFNFSLLGEAKRVAELFCTVFAEQYGFEVKIARCFSFVGPHLPLNVHYAIGNFMQNVLQNQPIHLRGDGTPLRSYLYMSDLMIWLWTILFNNDAQDIYNVGSEDAISIADLARLCAGFSDSRCAVTIAKSPKAGQIAERYIPSTQKAQNQLGLKQTIDLHTSIKKTLDFYANKNTSRLYV